MKKIGYRQEQNSERSDFFILFLAGIHNLIFVDISLAGMPLRTLLLLMADFVCITVCIYKGQLALPHWKECSLYEKMMAVMLAVSAVLLAVFALTESDHFWVSVDAAALLLIYPCICGRKRFPQDIFVVYSVSSFVTGLLLLCYYLFDGFCEPFIALLLKDGAMASWLLLGIMVNVIAYCFQEKGQIWYGANILLAAFLLAVQKHIPAMVIAGLVPLLVPVFCRPSKVLVYRAAQAELMYMFLICNMSLITGYTPLLEGIVTYDLEVSVYMELLLAVMGVWFFSNWDRYAQKVDLDATLPQMREWFRKAVLAYLISIMGIIAASELFYMDETSAWKGAAQVIINALKEDDGWRSGMFGQMGQRYGVLGIAVAGVLVYICIVQIHSAKRWRVKAHKLYRLIIAVCLMQTVFLPQTMASLPVYIMFFFLFMGTEEEQSQKITLDHGERGENQ